MSRIRGWIDGVLGRVTPTVLVVVALGILAAYGVLLAGLGRQPFTALDALVALVVALASTLFGTYLAATVARLRAKLDSTLVTALLLFLLFTPALDARELTGLSLAGVTAGLSKFVLAWRGRHIVNPAALGATIAWLSTLAVPGWWAGSAVMIWPVAILAAIVLYRTSTFLVGLVYVVIAVAGTWASMPAGLWAADAGLAFALPFTSFPYVFLAGFMLSEPLTLPGRRWQRLLVAVTVAVCSFLPLLLGTVLDVNFLPPEVALLIGNLVAWGFGARHALRFEVTGRNEAGSGVAEIELRPLTPLRYEPGQALELAIPHRADLRGQLRVLSLVSAPGDASVRLAFGVPGSKVSSAKAALLALRPGDAALATRVLGDFVLPRDTAVPVLLVAGGIGVTPFVSMLRANAAAAASGRPVRDLVLVYRASTASPAYADELAALADAGAGRLVTFFERRPDAAALADAVPDLARRIAYVSGPPRMVAALTAMLRRAGARRVRRDVFSGA